MCRTLRSAKTVQNTRRARVGTRPSPRPTSARPGAVSPHSARGNPAPSRRGCGRGLPRTVIFPEAGRRAVSAALPRGRPSVWTRSPGPVAQEGAAWLGGVDPSSLAAPMAARAGVDPQERGGLGLGHLSRLDGLVPGEIQGRHAAFRHGRASVLGGRARAVRKKASPWSAALAHRARRCAAVGGAWRRRSAESSPRWWPPRRRRRAVTLRPRRWRRPSAASGIGRTLGRVAMAAIGDRAGGPSGGPVASAAPLPLASALRLARRDHRARARAARFSKGITRAPGTAPVEASSRGSRRGFGPGGGTSRDASAQLRQAFAAASAPDSGGSRRRRWSAWSQSTAASVGRTRWPRSRSR